MGRDKASLTYRGQTEPDRLDPLLRALCRQVFKSVPAGRPPAPGFIVDNTPEIGPMGGILSALERHPTAAWLVIACDMPFVNASTLSFLVAGRAPNKLATCLSGTKGPEPLCTIYEPAIAAHLRASVAQNQYSPRRVLETLDIQRLTAPNPEALRNVNAPEEYEQARKRLEKEGLS